MSTKLIYGEA